MKTYTKKVTVTKLVIQHDDGMESPRTSCDNLGYFITVENRYNSPDRNEDIEKLVKQAGKDASNQADHMELITKRMNSELDIKVVAIYPVYRYEHSGVAYHLGTAHGFGYSNCGFYIVTDKTAKVLGIQKKDFEKVIKEELETYTRWANGEVYRYTLYNNKGDVVDSCCGFYDIKDIKENLPKEWAKENMRDYLVM